MLKIYRASAGSGKTFQLAKDYIELIFDPQKHRLHRRILAVTFTNKATDEMKTRILQELHALANGNKSEYKNDLMRKFPLMSENDLQKRAEKILIDILHDYSSFSISTIDGFFQQVIRAFAREIGVNGAYNLDLDKDRTLEQAVDNLFFDLSKEDNKQLLTWMSRFAEERVEQSESWNLKKEISTLGQEIFKEAFQYKADETTKKLHQKRFLTDYREKLYAVKKYFEDQVKQNAQKALRLMAEAGLTHQDFKRKMTANLEKIVQGTYHLPATLLLYADDVSCCYTKTAPQSVKDKIETIYNNGFQAAMLRLKQLWEVESVDYNTAKIILKRLNTLGILSDLSEQIKKLTEEQNTMLISDANLLLNKIIDGSDTPFVYEKTGAFVDHYMIDEFQDTSVLQWKNFRPLIADSLSEDHYNLLVGDVKQSIYRWRNSDWKLLDEQVFTDFRQSAVTTADLETNWRSDSHIVAFNNTFFHLSAAMIRRHFDAEAAPLDFPELSAKITHAYENVYQKISPKAGMGYVQINFIDESKTENNWKTETLNRLPALLEQLQDNGYKPADVGILVRTKEHAHEIINKILHHKTTPQAKAGYCYDIIGNQGLFLGQSASVKFIINVLQLFVHPEDSIKQLIVRYEYLKATCTPDESEALKHCFTSDDNGAFMEKEKNSLMNLKRLPLFDMIKGIINLFDIENWQNEIVFVQAFLDIVFRFSVGKTADLNSFLIWWEQHGADQQIAAPEGQKAFRIMTVHKSKGLDFKVVVIPFCDWNLSDNLKLNILWLEPQKAPFSELPLTPVRFESGMKQSIFAENYFDELMHQYIDSLNLAYVAFTRARNELICFAPLPKLTGKGEMKPNSVANLLYLNFKQAISSDENGKYIPLHNYFDNAAAVFELGKQQRAVYEEKKEESTQVKIASHRTTDVSGKLRIRHQGADYWLDSQELKDSNLNYGLIMHDVLKNISYRPEQEKAVEALIFEGRISEKEAEHVRMELEKFWQIPETAHWFDQSNRVLNEISILTPSGAQYRPDRVIIRGTTATVIDYKFGKIESDDHVKQLEHYMTLIAQIGYRTEGYLCYVSLQKVRKIV